MVAEYFRGSEEITAAHEEGQSFPLHPGRVARKLSHPILKRIPPEMLREGLLPTGLVRCILKEIREKSDNTTPWSIFQENITAVGNTVILSANKRAYPDMWLRDSLQATEFADIPSLEANILRTFEKKAKRTGQIPTAVALVGSAPWHFADDETTMLYLIWSCRLHKRTDGQFTPDPQVAGAALSFIRRHTSDGRYLTPPGPRHGWLDAFIYPNWDVNTQNQGLLPVALMCANRLGLPVSSPEINNAFSRYQQLADFNGYLPFSARFNGVHDVSVLYPEYLAMTILGEQLLPDEIVQNTIETMPRNEHGFKTVATAGTNGDDYFNPSMFIASYPPGQYQNGGVFLNWHGDILAVGLIHGAISKANYYWEKSRLARKLERTGWPETIDVPDESPEQFVVRNQRQLWDIAIPAQLHKAEKFVA